ncbi:transcriptional regulator [Pseudomonas sp. P115]|uniref:transcriptional regulator n=1 Tax=Pseudomonas pisciculturae TaxID=2730413 RepID=UPI0018922EE6|nr:transcriptional regulator [Pseudomonas pisciculturae]MBF6026142.1 transcriptional regulator [Pseudomonas pisciculturae]
MTSELNDLVSGVTTHLPLAKGIELRTLNAGAQLGLALQIKREALQARQVQRVLERRFEQALAYDGCYVFCNGDDALVLWHSLEPADGSLVKVQSRLLSLAGLEALDRVDQR